MLAALALGGLLLACNTSSGNQENTATTATAPAATAEDWGYFQPVGDSLLIPPFEVILELSEKAAQKLKKQQESILVDAMFTGVPTDTTSESYQMEGEIFVAESIKELTGAGTAKIEGVKISKKLYHELRDKDIMLLVNVFSARKSSEDNLLDCGIISDKMSVVKNRNFTVRCKLIYGE